MDEPLKLPPDKPVGELIWVAGGKADDDLSHSLSKPTVHYLEVLYF